MVDVEDDDHCFPDDIEDTVVALPNPVDWKVPIRYSLNQLASGRPDVRSKTVNLGYNLASEFLRKVMKE